MKEGNLQQLGLEGFGKETDSQLEAKRKAEEREQRIRVVPEHTIIYKPGLDKMYRVKGSFYVIKMKEPEIIKGVERVVVYSEDAIAVCEADKEWGMGDQLFPRGTLIEVPVNRLIKKK